MKIPKHKLSRVAGLPVMNNTNKPSRGLGDTIHNVLQPIIKAADKVFHTQLQNCKPCQKRRESLNNLVPYEEKPS